jgi:glycosyltransferase involved in cell wall biosynthesis
MNPKFSIIYPTKNRPDYLYYCLQSIKLQTFENFEVIISDNCENKSAEPIYLEYQKDSRFKYFWTGGKLSMSDNFSFAIKLAIGDYLTVLTDKVTLLPSALEVANKINLYNNFDVINWRETYFHNNILGIVNSPGYVIFPNVEFQLNTFNPKSQLIELLNFYKHRSKDPNNYYRGKIMFGFVRRELFAKEINESTFFLKYAPDYTSRVIILNRSINGCEIPFPIQNAFISESSNGMKCAIHPEFAYNFFNDADKLKNVNTFFPIKGMYASQQNHVAGDYMFALNMHNIHLSIDLNNLLKTIYFDLKKVKWPNRKIKKDNYYLFYNLLLHSSIYNILNFIFINFWTINFEINSLKLKSLLKKYFIDKYPMIQKFLELGIISKRHSCSNIIEANYKLDLLLRKWIEETDIKSTKC